MSSVEIGFFLSAGIAILAAIRLICSRQASQTIGAWSVCIIATACTEYFLLAPAVICLQILLVLLGWVIYQRIKHVVPSEPPANHRGYVVVSSFLLGCLAFILLGTWARQYLQTVEELPKDADFGQISAIGLALLNQYPWFLMLLVTIGLLIVVFYRFLRLRT